MPLRCAAAVAALPPPLPLRAWARGGVLRDIVPEGAERERRVEMDWRVVDGSLTVKTNGSGTEGIKNYKQ